MLFNHDIHDFYAQLRNSVEFCFWGHQDFSHEIKSRNGTAMRDDSLDMLLCTNTPQQYHSILQIEMVSKDRQFALDFSAFLPHPIPGR